MIAAKGRDRAFKLSQSPDPSKWLVLAAACLGLSLIMVDLFAVNVALPAMARNLDASVDTVQWVVTGYVLMFAVFPIIAGRIADIFGRREVYISGLVLFTAASVACSFAPDVYVLIAFRVVQGIGAAIMQPATLSVVTNAFLPQERGLAIGIWGGVSSLGLILGPVLGGLLVHGDGWRLIFLINLPIGLIALIMALRYVRSSRDESMPRVVDVLGVVILASALFLIMFGVSRGNTAGWGSAPIVGSIGAGGCLIPLFFLVEQRARVPLVDLSLFRSRSFAMACAATFLLAAAIFGSQPYTSLFMQNYWGFSPLSGGLAFLPSTVLIALLMPFSGVIGQRLGRHLRFIVMAGSICVALSFLYILRLDVGDRYFEAFLPAFVLRGAGVGLFMSATLLAVVSAAPAAKSGLAAGTVTMFRNIGTAAGVAVLGAVYLHHMPAAAHARLSGGEPDELSQMATAVGSFLSIGEGATRAAGDQLIVDGFVLISLVCVAMAVVATVAASFIRYVAPTVEKVSKGERMSPQTLPLAVGVEHGPGAPLGTGAAGKSRAGSVV